MSDSNKNIHADFCVLQMKPMLIEGLIKDTNKLLKERKNILFETNLGMGDGIISNIKDILISLQIYRKCWWTLKRKW